MDSVAMQEGSLYEVSLDEERHTVAAGDEGEAIRIARTRSQKVDVRNQMAVRLRTTAPDIPAEFLADDPLEDVLAEPLPVLTLEQLDALISDPAPELPLETSNETAPEVATELPEAETTTEPESLQDAPESELEAMPETPKPDPKPMSEAEQIRQLAKAYPAWSNKQIIETLKGSGVTVTSSQVSRIRSQIK